MTSETKIVGGILILAAAVLVGIVVLGGSSGSPAIEASPVKEAQLIREHSHSRGPGDAPVTVVEFADFQCPACARVNPMLEQLAAEYGDQIRWVHRHFPLNTHRNAVPAARAAEAAGFQSKFWEMQHLLYEEQLAWNEAGDPTSKFQELARQLELNVDLFMADLERDDSRGWISQDLGDANALGLTSTPTIFVNGQKIDAVTAYNDLTAAVDAALAVPTE